MERGYQQNYSAKVPSLFDVKTRERKAKTIIKVLQDYFGCPLESFTILNVGGSAGIIDNYLADHFASVVNIDIDEKAIHHAQTSFHKTNLLFKVGDALNLEFSDNCFDVVICSHVYEHVPNADKMMEEIYRVLKTKGVCYFAAGNRLMWNEPHHHLPLLSVLPRPLAHLYLLLAGKGNYYYEKHLTYWGLRKLVNNFECYDYTQRTVEEPEKFGTDYMVKRDTLVYFASKLIVKYFLWVCPGYIWLLKKHE